MSQRNYIQFDHTFSVDHKAFFKGIDKSFRCSTLALFLGLLKQANGRPTTTCHKNDDVGKLVENIYHVYNEPISLSSCNVNDTNYCIFVSEDNFATMSTPQIHLHLSLLTQCLNP